MASIENRHNALAGTRPPAVTRRHACGMGLAVLIGAIGAAVLPDLGAQPAQAEEATAIALASAQEQYAAVQGQLDDLAWQYEQKSIELAETMGALEAKQGEIDATQGQIDATQLQIEQTQAELETCQNELASVISANYKTGNATALDVIMASSDYDQLFENIYYLNKVSDEEARLIEHTREVKALLEQQQLDLENQKATLQIQYGELAGIRQTQELQLADMQQRQNETYALLSSLDDQVRALTDQYNAELIAQAEAAAAAAALRSAGGSYGEAYGNGSAASVVSACGYTPSPGSGWCAAWVTNVFVNAGVGYWGGDACDMYATWCYSSDQSTIQPGMIVAVSTWNGTSAGRIYGHVGVYVGGGLVMDNVGYIRTIDLGSWIGTYGTTVSPRWGWLGGVALS